jgi:hypothetical protein
MTLLGWHLYASTAQLPLGMALGGTVFLAEPSARRQLDTTPRARSRQRGSAARTEPGA